MSGGPDARSHESVAFEAMFLSLYDGIAPPARSAIDLGRFRRFARWLAIAEPMNGERRILVRLAGSGFYEFFGFDLTNSDYLDVLENDALRDDAYASANAMTAHPCGLWQRTPLLSNDLANLEVEFTAFPIFDYRSNAPQILLFVSHAFTDATGYPRALRVSKARLWKWIDLGHGVPP